MSNEMPRESMDELLGAYALDAVDETDRQLIEDYLAANPRARAEVEHHREVAALLAVGSERPPDGLWDRIAGSLEEAPPAPGPRLAQVMPIDSARRRRRTVLTALGAAAAAAVIAVAATVAIVRDDAVGGDAALAEAYADALAEPESRRTELADEGQDFTADAVLLTNGTGFLAAEQLPELPDTETWQLWGLYGDDDVISLGVLGNRPDLQAFTAHDDIQALVITREQAGGVTQSTTGAVLVGPLG